MQNERKKTEFPSLYSTKHSSYVSFSIKISEIQSRGGDELLRRTSTMPPEQVAYIVHRSDRVSLLSLVE